MRIRFATAVVAPSGNWLAILVRSVIFDASIVLALPVFVAPGVVLFSVRALAPRTRTVHAFAARPGCRTFEVHLEPQLGLAMHVRAMRTDTTIVLALPVVLAQGVVA